MDFAKHQANEVLNVCQAKENSAMPNKLMTDMATLQANKVLVMRQENENLAMSQANYALATWSKHRLGYTLRKQSHEYAPNGGTIGYKLSKLRPRYTQNEQRTTTCDAGRKRIQDRVLKFGIF